MNINTLISTSLSDTITPVGLYLKLRDQFHNSFLLESSDYHGNENNFSFICLKPLATFIAQHNTVTTSILGKESKTEVGSRKEVTKHLQNFITAFNVEKNDHVTNGIFGYSSYDAVQYFDTINFDEHKRKNTTPEMHYSLFQFIIQIDHFKNEMTILENCVEGAKSEIESIKQLVQNHNHPKYHFNIEGNQTSNITDKEFKHMVSKGKEHCQLGDVFQVVLSRQFSQKFKGDDFNVYRALRSINPSPYLFYFDFGDFKLFGSSPEAQLKVAHGKTTINPIAGTFKRTGNDIEDQKLAEALAKDPKENAEHTMLVDLARNDLSRHGKNVTIKTYKEVQFYSHVIHLVSEVEADNKNEDAIQMFADTFPAGTLSGAPKYRAMQLINKFENQNRGFYGGAIGIFGFDGSVNHAITIRSFMSKNNTLYSQAGAGITVNSNEDNELQEVNNKLSALKQALVLAENI
ncbi:MAG: anthranilate synthase component I family protein [Flavobacteriaceae bacterium]